ncbi:MAG: CHAT domain-containing protein, partial [Planctomycetota bacterium]
AGDPERAGGLIDDVIETARRLHLWPMLGDALHTRARVRRALGDDEGAVTDLREAVEQIERVRGSLPADRLRASYVEGRSGAYADLAAALLDRDAGAGAAEAFAVVEQSRCRSLLDLVAGVVEPATAVTSTPAASDADRRVVSEILALRGEINALYARLWEGSGTDAAESAEPEKRLRDGLEQRERRLQVLESRLAAAEGIGGLFAPPADLGAVRERLAAGESLVEYFVAGEELMAFVVDRDGCHPVRRLASTAQVRGAVERLGFEIGRTCGYPADVARRSEPLLAGAVAALRELHDLLLAPIAPHVDGSSRLVFVPWGPLHGVPFHALHDGAQFLLERHEVVYGPSASLLGHLPVRSRDAVSRPRSLVVGVADELAPRIDEEARAVAAVLERPTLLTGENASCANVVRAAADAELIHLACHGRFVPGRPLSAGLRLADGWLTVRDVYGLHLGQAVVVLSGCDTGRSAVAGGDDLVGLVSGFLAAGATGLVMSLWALSDDAAEKTMVRAYRMWQNDPGPGAMTRAVRSAQLALLAECPHPAFWAPLVVVGAP